MFLEKINQKRSSVWGNIEVILEEHEPDACPVALERWIFKEGGGNLSLNSGFLPS